jgi:plasmid stabilization system protein ParE
MCGKVRRVCECGVNLGETQRILGGDCLRSFASGERADDGRDINASAAEAGLPKAHIRVHRDAREHFHAPTLVDAVFDRFELLVEQPRMGRNRPEFGKGVCAHMVCTSHP